MSDESSGILVLAVLALVAWIGYEGWPVTGWLLAAGSAYWALSLLRKRAAVIGLGPNRFPVLQAIIGGLATTSGWFTLGVGSVWGVQLFSKLIAQFVDEATVRKAENAAGHAKFVLDSAFAPKYLVAILVLLIAMTAVAPQAELASRFGQLRRYVSRAGAFLVGLTSFSFVTSTCIGVHEEAWVAKRRSEVREHLTHIERLTADIDTMTGLALELRQLPPRIPHALQDFLVHAQGHPNRDVLLAWRADKIAESAAPEFTKGGEEGASVLSQPVLREPARRTLETMQELERWIRVEESTSPTLQQVLDVGAARERMQARWKESETILAETLKLVVGAGIPAEAEGVVKLFAKSLTGAIASHVAKRTFDDPTKLLSRAALYLSLTTFRPYAVMPFDATAECRSCTRWTLDLPAENGSATIALVEERIEVEAFDRQYGSGYHPADPAFRALVSGVPVEENGHRYEPKPIAHTSGSESAASPERPVHQSVTPREGSYGVPSHHTRRIIVRR